MDGPLLATIISGVVVVRGAVCGGSWKVWNKLADQSRSIGRLEGKMDGLHTRMRSFEKQVESLDKSVDRLDRRMNGYLDSMIHKEGEGS